MKAFFEKIAGLDFRKPAKRLAAIALIVILAGGALCAWMMRTQIGELAVLDKAEEQSIQFIQGVMYNGEEEDCGEREADPLEAGLVTRPSAPATAGFICWTVLSGLCVLAYWLMVAAWLYKASAGAEMNSALWTILGFVGNILAVAAFLIARGRRSHCSVCGKWQKPSEYCRACGSPLQQKCPRCGKPCAAADVYCPECGAPLKAASEIAVK